MQKQGLKILIVFFLTVFISPVTLSAQHNDGLLLKADSLFLQKRYTQSFEIYQKLFESHQYTHAMLLKMAYIQEGLNRISQSAYYLNLYYLATRDAAAQSKLEEIADKYRLEGYVSSEADKFFSMYQQYGNLITTSLTSVAVFFFLLSMIQGIRYRIKPYTAWGALVFITIILIVHLNLGDRYSQAIIVNNNSYLMDGPSAGASVVGVVRDGHRVQVLGKEDVWLKISWGDSEAYIKESNLVPVRL